MCILTNAYLQIRISECIIVTQTLINKNVYYCNNYL